MTKRTGLVTMRNAWNLRIEYLGELHAMQALHVIQDTAKLYVGVHDLICPQQMRSRRCAQLSGSHGCQQERVKRALNLWDLQTTSFN
eukprot:3987292-Amphidinium_carterae.1